jgi:leucyl/phenylalanyl-tRNA--protein transferase
VITWLSPDGRFPPVERALKEPNGLLAVGGDLSPELLLDAYRRGIFPWYSEGQPVLWWCPDPRSVLYLHEFRVTRSLRKRVRQGCFELRVDSAFDAVMRACALPRARQAGTWITQEVIDAYTGLHRLGYAHSVESWLDDRLAGGLYGVAVGRMFFGESMFAHETDASKVALVGLVSLLEEKGFPMIDCQQATGHLERFGARSIPRARFAEEVSRLVDLEVPGGHWAPPADL